MQAHPLPGSWPARAHGLFRALLRGACLVVLLGAAGFMPRVAHADALSLIAQLGPVVNPYIAPAKLEWVPPIAAALSSPACSNLGSDAGVVQCTNSLLSSDAAAEFGGDANVKSVQTVLEIYLDVRAGDWVELFNDLFRLATGGSPLDVACLAIAVVAGGFPACDVLKLLYDVGGAIVDGAAALAGGLNNLGESLFTSQTSAMPWGQYFAQNWTQGEADYVARQVVQGNNGNAWTAKVGPIYDACYNYFNSHKLSSDNSKGVCNDMRDGTSTHIGEFQDKGFAQLVRWRQQAYLLPAAVEKATQAAIAQYDTPQGRQLPPPTPALKAWWPDQSGFSLAPVIRSVFGKPVKSDDVDQWPAKTVGALAAVSSRAKTPDAQDSARGADAAITSVMSLVNLPGRIEGAKKTAWDQQFQVATQLKALNASFKAQLEADLKKLLALCTNLANQPNCRLQAANADKACGAAFEAFIAKNPDTFNPDRSPALRNQLRQEQDACYAAAADTVRAANMAAFNASSLPNPGALLGAGAAAAAAAAPASPPVAGNLPPTGSLSARPPVGGMPSLPPAFGANPQAGATAGGRIGMPGLPTMGALPPVPRLLPPQVVPPAAGGAVAGNPPVAVVPPGGTLPAAVPPAAPAPAPAPTPVIVSTVPPPGAAVGFNNQQLPPGLASGAVNGAVAAAVFNAAAYRTERERSLGREWSPKCRSSASCLQAMPQLITRRVTAEVDALAAGRPDFRDAAAVARFQEQNDRLYQRDFEALLPQAVTPTPVTPGISTVPKVNQIRPGAIRLVP